MITCKILPNGNLQVTADNETRKEIKDLQQRGRNYWSIMHDLFESYSCNGSYTPFDAGQANPFVGLTSAPCIAESLTTEDDGTNVIEGRLWYYANYMIDDPLEDLKNKGVSIWQNAEHA